VTTNSLALCSTVTHIKAMVLSTNTSLLSQSHHPCHPATPPTVIDIITAQTLVVATPACVNVLIVYIIKPVITPSLA